MAGKVKITKYIEGGFKEGTPAGERIPFFEMHCKQQKEKYTEYSALQLHSKSWSRSSCYLGQVA
jgi:hypothetical protein